MQQTAQSCEFSPPMKMSMSRKIRKNEEKGNLHTGAGNTFFSNFKITNKTTYYSLPQNRLVHS